MLFNCMPIWFCMRGKNYYKERRKWIEKNYLKDRDFKQKYDRVYDKYDCI